MRDRSMARIEVRNATANAPKQLETFVDDELSGERSFAPSHADATRTMNVDAADSVVVEDGSEMMMPLSAVAADNTQTVKKERAESPLLVVNSDNDESAPQRSSASFVDWLTMALAEELIDAIEASNQTTPATAAVASSPQPISKLEWLKTSLNFKKNANSSPHENKRPTAGLLMPSSSPSTNFAASLAQHSIAPPAYSPDAISTMLADANEKDDWRQYEKTKFSWAKLNSAPLSEDAQQNLPIANEILFNEAPDVPVAAAMFDKTPDAFEFSPSLSSKEQYLFNNDGL